MNWLGIGRCRLRGNAGAPIATPSPVPSPTPTPTPSGTLPAWILVADAPAKPPTAGGSVTISPAGGTLASQIAGLDGTTSRVFCAPGNYGDNFNITKFPAMGQVTLAAADPANPPYFSAWQTSNQNALAFEGAGNLAFDGWEFRAPNVTSEADAAALGANIIKINGCTNMRFTRTKFIGGVGSTTGIGLGRAVNVVAGTNIQLDRLTFQDVGYGIGLQSYQGTKTVNTYIGFCDFTNLKAVDFIDAYGVYKILVENNELWDVRFLHDDLHTDFFQGGSMYDGIGTGGVEHLVQRGNLCGATNAATYVNGPAADGRTHNYPQFSWLTHEPYQGVFDYVVVVDNELYGPGNQAIANNGAGNHYYVARNQIYGSSRADYQIGNSGGLVAPVIRATGDRGQSFDDIYIHDNVLPGGSALVNVGNGIDGSGSYTNTVTHVDVANNTAPASQLSDVQFLAAKSTWETARAALY